MEKTNNIPSSPSSGDLNEELIPVEKLIHVIRRSQVMVDSDLARLHGVETRRLNEQVKRNADRFPEDFMFKLTKDEAGNLMSQNATSNRGDSRKTSKIR